MTETWPEVLGALVARPDLTADQTAWAMGEILAGEATPAQIAGFAVALRAKGETIDEVTGLVDAMYAGATPITVPGRLLDVVGTGGDRSMSVNISTMAAIVAAGAGARVVKHGNRSASSQSGSADVLEALGIRLDLPPERVAARGRGGRHHLLLRRRLPPGHAARRRAAARARHRHHLQLPRPAGQPGPPGRPGDRLRRPADGAGDGRRLRPARRRRVGLPRRRRARRAHHHDDVVGVGGRATARSRPRPSTRAALGLAPATTEDLRGGDAAHNADVVRRLLGGRARARCATPCCSTPARALAVHAADSGAEDALAAGIGGAREAVDSGAARPTLDLDGRRRAPPEGSATPYAGWP